MRRQGNFRLILGLLAACALVVGVLIATGAWPALGGHRQEETVLIIDVRTPAEFANGHLQGAVNMDMYNPDFVAQADALDRGREIKLYCESGARAQAVANWMLQSGFTDVVNLGSPQAAAAATGLPLVRP